MGKRISEDMKKEIVLFYLSKPMTFDDVCAKFDLSRPTVGKILAAYRIKLWSKAQLFSPDLNERYFKTIDTETKAYLLGFITTDGCVFWKNRKRAFLSIELKKSDKYVLDLLMRETKCNRRLVYNPKSDTYTASIHSTQMVIDLQQYGIHPRSSMDQRLSDKVPGEFLNAYLRGIFDGDGSFAFYARPHRKVHRKAVRLCSGSKEFIDDVCQTISDILHVHASAVHVGSDNTYSVSWVRNNDVEAIIAWLYPSEDTVCLARKRLICEKIVDEIRQYRDNYSHVAS